MSSVVDLSAWKRRRTEGETQTDGPGSPVPAGARLALPPAGLDDAAVGRLEEAVGRLHELVSTALDGQGRLEPKVETELLAIMGELTVGLITEAAVRAERLAAQLGGE